MRQLIHSFRNLGLQPDSLRHVDRLGNEAGRNGFWRARPPLTETERTRFDMATTPEARGLYLRNISPTRLSSTHG